MGWLSATGWQTGVVTIPFMAGTIIQGLVVLNTPDYDMESWHGTLLVVAVSVCALVVTTIFASKLPAIESFLFYAHYAGFIAIIASIWATGTKADAREVLLTFENNGGWPSTGLASLIGVITPLNAINGYDCAVHMCTERPVSLGLWPWFG